MYWWHALTAQSRSVGCPQGLREGGAGGYNDPGAHDLERGPIEIALSNKRPIEIAIVDFFFWRSLDFGRKNSRNFGEDLFFSGDHLILAGKTVETVLDFTKPGAHPVWGGLSHYIWAREGAHPFWRGPSHHTWAREGAIQFEGAHPIWRGPSHRTWAREGAHPIWGCPSMFELSPGPRSALGAPGCLREWPSF